MASVINIKFDKLPKVLILNITTYLERADHATLAKSVKSLRAIIKDPDFTKKANAAAEKLKSRRYTIEPEATDLLKQLKLQKQKRDSSPDRSLPIPKTTTPEKPGLTRMASVEEGDEKED